MSIGKELENLKEAYERVASAVEKELPDVWSEAINVWKDRQAAARFMSSPHMLMEGKSPAELASQSEEGRKQVKHFLGQMQAGVYL